MHLAKTQISLDIQQVWSESSLSAWRTINCPLSTQRIALAGESSLGAHPFCWLCRAPTHFSANPGRFAHFPVRPWVVSPTFSFAPSRFVPGSFRPLSRSPPSRFAHFPFRPRVVSPPYKILFLLLIHRPQKWYKALIVLLIWDFSL